MNRSFRVPENLMRSIKPRVPQLKSLQSSMREKDEDLALFLQMRKCEKEKTDLLLLHFDELDESLVSQPGSSPLFNIPSTIPARKLGADDFLNSDTEKNDYNWLMTPPGTPLFPSLETESRKSDMNDVDASKPQPTVLRSRLANSQTETTMKSSLVPKQPPASAGLTSSVSGVRRPSSSGGPGSRPVTPRGPGSRPATPTGRPTLSSPRSSRPSMPTSRATLPSAKSTVHSSSPKPKPTASLSSTRSTISTASTKSTAPSRSSTPSRTTARPSTPSNGPSRSSTRSRSAPRSSMPTRSTARSSTPTRSTARSSTPTQSTARSSTPTSRPTVSASRPTVSASRPTVPASRSSVPASRPTSRSSTPTRRPSTQSSIPAATATLNASSSSVSSKSGTAPSKNPVPSRGASPTVRSRPWNPSEMPGFSLEAPPNLRTTLPDRPLSATRGRPVAPSTRSASIEPVSNGRQRRQSCSPSRGHAPSGSIHSSGSSMPGATRGHSKVSNDVNPMVIGAKMVERVINMRKLGPRRQDDKHSPSLSGKSASSPDSSGFGRSLSKKSLDMTIRHMDIRRSIPGNLRPLMTKIPASSMYTVRSGPTGSRATSVCDSPLATSSNASSELSVNNRTVLMDGLGSELEDDLASEVVKLPQPVCTVDDCLLPISSERLLLVLRMWK